MRLKNWNQKNDKTWTQKGDNGVRVKISILDDRTYAHAVFGTKENHWHDLVLASFLSRLPRTSILTSLKEFFGRGSFQSELALNTYRNHLGPGDKIDNTLEEYLDKVEKLPAHLRAVTMLLRLDGTNSHAADFEENLRVAKTHHGQWDGKVLDDISAEMFYFPLAGQWGEVTWETIRNVAFDYFIGSKEIQKSIIKNCQDAEYRDFIDKMIRISDELVFGKLKKSKVRTILSEELDDESQLMSIGFTRRDWILYPPIEDPEFREEALDLTIEDFISMSARGLHCSIPEIWRFNAKQVKEFREAGSSWRKDLLSEISDLINEKTTALPNSTFVDQLLAASFIHAPESYVPKRLPSFYRLFIDYLKESGEGEEFVAAYQLAHPIFLNPESNWGFEDEFGNHYLLDRLVAATGSVKEAVSIIADANATRADLLITDWFTFIEHYDKVRGVDLEIAVQLLKEDAE